MQVCLIVFPIGNLSYASATFGTQSSSTLHVCLAPLPETHTYNNRQRIVQIAGYVAMNASFDAKRETVCLFCIVSDTIVNNPYNPTSWLTFDAIRLGP